MITSLKSFGQTAMSPKDAFYFYLKINNISPNDRVYYNYQTYFPWVNIYAAQINNDTYKQNIDDEFKKNKYLSNMYSEMQNGINNIDFNKLYYALGTVELEEYNFGCSCFPVKSFRNDDLIKIIRVGEFDVIYNTIATIYLRYFLNRTDLDFSVKMKSLDAEKFIDSRKDSRGNINRKIKVKFLYNVVNKPIPGDKNLFPLDIYVHKMEFYTDNILLSTTVPRTNYYDKVNFIKIKDGIEKTYLDKDMYALDDDKVQFAKYYRTKTYVDGKVNGPLIDYYISGAKRMEGFESEDRWNGRFSWFYENGNKWAEGTYVNSKLNGNYIEWHPNGQLLQKVNYNNGKKNGLVEVWYSNGQKKEEVNYINDIHEGCYYKWKENGECQASGYGNNVDYWEKGTNHGGSSTCPCKKASRESKNNKDENTYSQESSEGDNSTNENNNPNRYLIVVKNGDTLVCDRFDININDELGLKDDIRKGVVKYFNQCAKFTAADLNNARRFKKVGIFCDLLFSYSSILVKNEYEYFARCNYTFKIYDYVEKSEIKSYTKSVTNQDIVSFLTKGSSSKKDALGNLLLGKMNKEIQKFCNYLPFTKPN